MNDVGDKRVEGSGDGVLLSNGCKGAVDGVDFGGVVVLYALEHGGIIVGGFVYDLFGFGYHIFWV